MIGGSAGRGAARLLRALRGGDASALLALLGAQLAATAEGAALVGRLVSGAVAPADARRQMREVEHDGDQARGRLVSELGRVLSSPIDGEDLFRLSRSIDDVLDNLRDFVREADLYGCRDLGFAGPLAEQIGDGLAQLAGAVGDIGQRPGEVRRASLAVRKTAGKVRSSYQQELAHLFGSELDAEVLKRRELLRRLDVVGLRMAEAADALADGVLKRSR